LRKLLGELTVDTVVYLLSESRPENVLEGSALLKRLNEIEKMEDADKAISKCLNYGFID
jgi:hypothetical protein